MKKLNMIKIAMRQKIADDISPQARQNLHDYATADPYETTDGKYWVQPKNPYKSDLFITKKLGIFKNIWQNKIRKR